jgi:1,4-dihydroxy-2-naphthoate polyprenyltransferase
MLVKSPNPWLLAIRPKTLFASLGPVIIGASAVLVFEKGSFSYLIFHLVALTALLLQISSNLINDYYDFKSGVDKSERIGPKRVTQAGLISPYMMKRAFIFTLGFSFLLGVYLMYVGGAKIVAIGLSSLIFCFLYTGGPYPLSHYALGEILAFAFFGPVPVIGTYLLLRTSNVPLPLDLYYLGAGVGFLSALLMSINNLRDIEEDRASGKLTLAVLLGFNNAKLFSFLLLLLSAVMLILSKLYPVLLLYLIFFKKWIDFKNMPRSIELNLMLAFCGKFLFLYSLAASACLFFL